MWKRPRRRDLAVVVARRARRECLSCCFLILLVFGIWSMAAPPRFLRLGLHVCPIVQTLLCCRLVWGLSVVGRRTQAKTLVAPFVQP